jgi:hypothetical protein
MNPRLLPRAIVILSLISCAAYASGVFTLKGKLKGFTDDRLIVLAGMSVYEVRKSALSPSQLTEVKSKKSGQPIELVLSTESIVVVRDDVK